MNPYLLTVWIDFPRILTFLFISLNLYHIEKIFQTKFAELTVSDVIFNVA